MLVHALNHEISKISFSFFGCVYFNSSFSCSGYLENRPTLPAAQSELHSEVWVKDTLCLHRKKPEVSLPQLPVSLGEIPTGKTSLDPESGQAEEPHAQGGTALGAGDAHINPQLVHALLG